jgi:hypothetical protein
MTAYEFVNGSWFDGTSFQKRTWYSVNGILHPNRPFDVDKVIDLQGMYVIPACGEAHNHNATNDNPAALKRYIHDGILYVWNPSNLPNQRVGEFINTPKGVDVKFSNGGLTAPGGHPLGLVKRNIERGAMKESDGEGAFYFTIGSAADLDAKWPKIVAGAPDFVKTFLVYSEEYAKRKDDPKYFSRRGLDPALLPLIVRKAEQANLPVVAHVESAHDFHVAVGAGVRQINHMPGFWPNDASLKDGDFSRYRITDDDARRAGRKHITVVTTISESLEMIRDKKLPDAIGAKLLDTYRSNLALLKKHHVPILIGSDRFRLESQTEAIALVSSGLMTNLETLKAWCETTPQAMFSNRRLGRIKDGYEANFFAVPSDPLNNFENVKDVRRVFKNGEELARE